MLRKHQHRLIRLSQIAIALTLLITVQLLWQQQRLHRQALLATHAMELADNLMEHAAHSAAMALKLDDDAMMQWVVTRLNDDPRVLSASIFNYQGHRLAFAQSLFPDADLPEQAELELALRQFSPLTTPITHGQEAYGYLRMRINHSLFFLEQRHLQQTQQRETGLLLLLSGLIGFILARALSFKRASYSHQQRLAKRQKKRATHTESPVQND
ncbi:AhpA/YtjB family protein [Ferrimonas pelagia]|uniref:Virulence factor, hemolysin regulator n=1 Tax=Ferrimonas pelagia TaxID=1177826 RepID=A0ABP9ED35_9GAMM